jgi:hypothetical protein
MNQIKDRATGLKDLMQAVKKFVEDEYPNHLVLAPNETIDCAIQVLVGPEIPRVTISAESVTKKTKAVWRHRKEATFFEAEWIKILEIEWPKRIKGILNHMRHQGGRSWKTKSIPNMHEHPQTLTTINHELKFAHLPYRFYNIDTENFWDTGNTETFTVEDEKPKV